ncbi:hypothetical protein KFK09_008980 [Dendrobium nobile]|uniref:Uncharacterized protein n=1 Tax=Dendrobium nobile TaxID=94219 RepID=A0A8T3BPH8_DENNO|nr:hypothetical protein KFK09_008980 [Dendrobium nobile]
MCKPKNKGGLGIPALQAIRYAYDCPLIFRISNWESPLSTWYLSKYCSPWKPPPTTSSDMWKSICNIARHAKTNFVFKITDNSPISLKMGSLVSGSLYSRSTSPSLSD